MGDGELPVKVSASQRKSVLFGGLHKERAVSFDFGLNIYAIAENVRNRPEILRIFVGFGSFHFVSFDSKEDFV